ncbi:MAG: hypothetical protein WC340_14615 [Kiritimatiellia bacterium]
MLHILHMACSMLLVVTAATGGETTLGEPIEADSKSGAQVYLLGANGRPADNIYCEQPYNDPTGRWIAIRYYPKGEQPGGISVLDLTDGSRRDVFTGKPRFPAFHAWGKHLYFQQTIDGKLMLRRCCYETLECNDVAQLPGEMGWFSYGTVSQDLRYFAVCVTQKEAKHAKVHLLDFQTGKWRLLLDKPGYHAKHEQFSLDGRNRVLIQLNKLPDIKQVLLGELTVDGEEFLFPADRPHTPRPTGHESWIGTSDRIFFSTRYDNEKNVNIWTAKVGERQAVPVGDGKQSFGHVSVSRCGRYWICDTSEKGIPIYIGKFGSGTCKRLIFSRTVYDNKQWSHAHPYMTADNQWVVFNSTRGGHAQVYGARLKPGWLDSL